MNPDRLTLHNRMTQQARRRALQALAYRHQDEYDDLYVQARDWLLDQPQFRLLKETRDTERGIKDPRGGKLRPPTSGY